MSRRDEARNFIGILLIDKEDQQGCILYIKGDTDMTSSTITFLKINI